MTNVMVTGMGTTAIQQPLARILLVHFHVPVTVGIQEMELIVQVRETYHHIISVMKMSI